MQVNEKRVERREEVLKSLRERDNRTEKSRILSFVRERGSETSASGKMSKTSSLVA